jgi:hypothetical protein
MANYFVIGGDNKEYGPVTDADVRQWISEGRLSADSRVKAESDAEFRALGQFPEFAAALGAKAFSNPPGVPLTPAGNAGREAALGAVKAPAICLQALAGLNVLMSLWNLINLGSARQAVEEKLSQIPQFQDPSIHKMVAMIYGPVGMAGHFFAILMAGLIFWGAFKMQRLEGYAFALTAAILAMIPCVSACCLLGLPFGIWALIMLTKSEIKSQFT